MFVYKMSSGRRGVRRAYRDYGEHNLTQRHHVSFIEGSTCVVPVRIAYLVVAVNVMVLSAFQISYNYKLRMNGTLYMGAELFDNDLATCK